MTKVSKPKTFKILEILFQAKFKSTKQKKTTIIILKHAIYKALSYRNLVVYKFSAREF